MYVFRAVVFVIALASVPAGLSASPIIIDFEGLSDSEILTTQIPGLTFTNATALTAGINLNEFEFPPASGINAVFDTGGPMRIDFATPLAEVGGRFNYLVPLVFEAFDSLNFSLGTVGSSFSSNLALSGDAGSVPNEFIGLAFGNISYITIKADPSGGSFTLDDLVISQTAVPVPEPGTLPLFLLGLISALVACRIRQRS